MASNYTYKRVRLGSSNLINFFTKKIKEEDDIECEICCTPYDEKKCRPKNLPCGHTFCNICMAKEMSLGKHICANCRKPHNARYVADLPYNVVLEKFIRNKKRGENEDDDAELTGGPCPKHKGSIVYFYCHTHSLNICRECTVIDHPSTQCNLLSFKEGIEKSKELFISQASSTITSMNDTVSNLGEFVKEKDSVITNTEAMIQQLKRALNDNTKNLLEDKGACEKARNEISKAETKKREFESAKRNLHNSKTKKVTAKCNNEFITATRNIKNWIEDVSIEFDLVQEVLFDETSPSPTNILKGLGSGIIIYAETCFNGRKGVAKFKSKDEKLHLHPFKYVTSHEECTLVEYEKVRSYFPSPPTLLFMDLEFQNADKGRIYIRLKPELHPFIKNIPSLVTGEKGSSIIGNSCIRKAGQYHLGINIEKHVDDIEPCKTSPVVTGNGDVVCNLQGHLILHMYIFFEKGRPYPAGYAKIGHIESGIEVAEACRKLGKHLQENITISDCGLVLDM